MGPSLRTTSASGHFGPIRQVDPGPMGVAPAEAQSGRMAGRGVKSTSYRGNPEGHRLFGGLGRLAGKVVFTFPVRPTDPPKTNKPQPETPP